MPTRGLAYVKRTETGANGREQQVFYVWPVVKETDTAGNLTRQKKNTDGKTGGDHGRK